jgi:hypothetical protein
MSNPFGGFANSSPLCSTNSPNINPILHLASNTIRDFFGPTVQTVADCLISEAACHFATGGGGSSTAGYTFAFLLQKIKSVCARDVNHARLKLLSHIPGAFHVHRARGPETSGYVVSPDAVRAALIVLIQHSIVISTLVRPSSESQDDAVHHSGKPGAEVYRYSFDIDRSRFLIRYPRYIEYTHKAIDDNASTLIEELLVHGRLLTEDVVVAAVQNAAIRLLAQKQAQSASSDSFSMPPPAKKVKTENGENDSAAQIKTEVKDEAEATATEVTVATVAEVTATEATVSEATVPETPDVGKNDVDDAAPDVLSEEEMDEIRQKVLESFKKLIDGGYVEKVPPLQTLSELRSAEEAEDAEFEEPKSTTANKSNKKEIKPHAEIFILPKRSKSARDAKRGSTRTDASNDHKKKILSMIAENGVLRQSLAEGTAWRANAHMFHSVLRAFSFGRLVAERYGDKIPSCGSIISASLKFVAFQKYSPLASTAQMGEQQRMETIGIFTPKDILDMLPRTVQDNFKNKAGGATANLSQSLVDMAHMCTWPQVILEVEDAQGHPLGGKFEVSTKQIADHLQRRVLHQILIDQHDERAARVVSILEAQGFLDVDAVADAVMVPANDVREVLHRLQRARLVTMCNLQQSSGAKYHNQGTAVYLWGVDRFLMMQTLKDNICLALNNVRLRRQHEMLLGKDFVERAKDPGVDENEHVQDKVNYKRFCQGLELLDKAAMQLDETLMVMIDFAKW